MIKQTITAAFIVCAVFAAKAQYLGLKGGLTFSNLNFEEVDDRNMRTGFNAGVYFNFPLTETFAIQPEVNFTTKGATAEYDILSYQGEYSFNMSYIDIPLMGVIRLDEAFELHLGPYFGLLANTSLSTDGDFGEGQEELDSDNFQNLDYGLAGGLALNLSAIQVGARYHYGLQKVADSEAAETFLGDARHSYLQVYGALRIGDFD